jgi:hypothetical protein
MKYRDACPERSTPMVRLPNRILTSARTLTWALAFVILPPTLAQAQFPLYGGTGFGFPGVGYGGMGYPGMGYGGLGYPGMGFGGVGYPGMGYGGLGMGYGGLGFGGFGAAGFGAATGFPTLGAGFVGYNPYGYGGYYANYSTPMFGLGLTPLGVNSALTERYLLGRGLPTTTVAPGGNRPPVLAPPANPR